MADSRFRAVVVEEHPFVAMTTAPNPGPKTLSGTHTYLVGRNPTYVVDPGPVHAAYQESVAGVIRALGLRPAGILLSHGHPDHAPGAGPLKSLLDVPIFGSPEMPSGEAALAGLDRVFAAHESFAVDSHRLLVLAAPGHARDQVAFWLPGARILLTGDTILGEGSTLVAPPEGDMADYMETLERFRALQPRVILPGHGPVVDRPMEKIEEYISHRRDRERRLLGALSPGPATIDDLVALVYTDIDPRLLDLARGSVAAQLEKLVREGRVGADGETYRLRPA